MAKCFVSRDAVRDLFELLGDISRIVKWCENQGLVFENIEDFARMYSELKKEVDNSPEVTRVDVLNGHMSVSIFTFVDVNLGRFEAIFLINKK